eukprot:8850003-Lingulodinium_polyedra.AAC.1
MLQLMQSAFRPHAPGSLAKQHSIRLQGDSRLLHTAKQTMHSYSPRPGPESRQNCCTAAKPF